MTVIRLAIGFVLGFIIGAGCRYFDSPAASPPVIPGALMVLAMTLGYSSMDRVLVRKNRTTTLRHVSERQGSIQKETLVRTGEGREAAGDQTVTRPLV
jgi:XapX domain-containing protein